MALTTSNLAVTTSAAVLGTPRNSRDALIITNPSGSGVSVYVAGSTVSSTNYAYILAAGDPPLVISDGTKDSLAALKWYIRASGSGTVYVTENGL